MISERQVYVYIQLPGALESIPAAVLRVQTLSDGMRIGRFRYGDRYLQHAQAIALDPYQLPLDKVVYEFTKLKGIPGAMRDASPDAWGRRVIEFKLEKAAGELEELDYLLHGPQDNTGNLGFGLHVEPPPPKRQYNRTYQLVELVKTAQAIEDGQSIPASLLQQFDPGTSMGGARPKATIEDLQYLWLGKFPARSDRCNLQRIEYATLELARRCGLNVARARLQTIGDIDVLMVQRFDRDYTDNGYLRFGFVSSLTVLNCDDNYLDRARWSYPLFADNLRRWSDKPETDCVELFRRMAFNAAVTNNDDHPRNHALLHRQRGWRLSPAYDLVPTPLVSLERRELALSVGDFGRTASIYNLLSQVGRFGLSIKDARDQINHIVKIVQQWREVFFNCGVSVRDMDYIAPAILPECFFLEKCADS